MKKLLHRTNPTDKHGRWVLVIYNVLRVVDAAVYLLSLTYLSSELAPTFIFSDYALGDD
jgi:hypothetical protein